MSLPYTWLYLILLNEHCKTDLTISCSGSFFFFFFPPPMISGMENFCEAPFEFPQLREMEFVSVRGMCSYETERNSSDSWNCYHWMAQWMAISHLLFLVSLSPKLGTTKNHQCQQMILCKSHTKKRMNWNLGGAGIWSTLAWEVGS